jgi:hypothetical protein
MYEATRFAGVLKSPCKHGTGYCMEKNNMDRPQFPLLIEQLPLLWLAHPAWPPGFSGNSTPPQSRYRYDDRCG